MYKQKLTVMQKRKLRNRYKIKKSKKLRFCVFRSGHHIYAQIIDDSAGKTLVSASSIEKGFGKGNNIQAASIVGKNIAKRAIDNGISEVVFDKGCYLYHGRVKSLAEAARENGLSFEDV